jgi:hypothetical protein
MDEDNAKFLAAMFMVMAGLATFCLGISEAVFVSRYDEFDDQCRQIWQWILAACVFDITIPVLSLCGIRSLLKDSDDSSSDSHDTLIYFLRIGSFTIMIWSGITYFNIDSSCHYFWTSQAPELWTFVMIHFVVLWLYVGVACLAGLCLGCGICLSLFSSEENKKIMRQKSQTFNTIANKLERG